MVSSTRPLWNRISAARAPTALWARLLLDACCAGGCGSAASLLGFRLGLDCIDCRGSPQHRLEPPLEAVPLWGARTPDELRERDCGRARGGGDRGCASGRGARGRGGGSGGRPSRWPRADSGCLERAQERAACGVVCCSLARVEEHVARSVQLGSARRVPAGPVGVQRLDARAVCPTDLVRRRRVGYAEDRHVEIALWVVLHLDEVATPIAAVKVAEISSARSYRGTVGRVGPPAPRVAGAMDWSRTPVTASTGRAGRSRPTQPSLLDQAVLGEQVRLRLRHTHADRGVDRQGP